MRAVLIQPYACLYPCRSMEEIFDPDYFIIYTNMPLILWYIYKSN